MSTSAEILSVQQLSVAFKHNNTISYAVKGVDFNLRRGETLALLGESGCGKSMTALAIMRLLPTAAYMHSDSKIELSGTDISTLAEVKLRKVRGRRIAIIFQDPMTALNPVLTIGEQIAEVIACHFSLDQQARQQRVLALLAEVGVPDASNRYHSYSHQLSGGLKQRVAIAMALAGEPEILIADEPSTALDVTIQAQILALLQQIQRDRQMAILFITHDLAVVQQMADRVAVMYAGHIVEQADSKSFFAKPSHPYSQALFAALPTTDKREQALTSLAGLVTVLGEDEMNQCRFAARCAHAYDSCRQKAPLSYQLNETHGVRCHLYTEGKTITAVQRNTEKIAKIAMGEELLRVEGLRVHFPLRKGLLKRTYGYVRAVDGIDLSLRAGQTLALVGESGCGKTTAGQSLLRLIPPTAGDIYFKGENISRIGSKQLRRMRQQMQIVFQDPYSAMNPRMMVGDIIAEGLTRAQRRQGIDHLLTQVGLPIDSQYRYPHEFSGGQRQRICIARALAVQPQLIICDEPTSALDVSVQAQILNLLRQLQADLGVAFLFISHNIAVVSFLADEVAVMYLGRIVERGTVDEIFNNPQHPYTQALLAAAPSIDGDSTVARLAGELPSPTHPPSGCHFHPRCPHATDTCRTQSPPQKSITASQQVVCWL